uniref:DNA polymerase III subunit gamma and tau n=1 Tax=uncultured Micrococcus sp. TaxID=114051 RepID=UPI00261F7E41|nr:DNA polymerase III subunit gamma and tau [uncultured Micrococcus sp.]
MSTALYRRYRPDRFEEVIGQDHVTVPLRTALSKDRVSHAYLFSGPRGCGKTTSARILARCLNCVKGPTPTPCGECDSCRDLATGGPGSLDVMEIDAASHGGVEDARGLRERATFAPVRDRYKILIIDEAHMVTAAGFNALLKIVEEPPEHLKFIFATTEPEKVIGTIRSRTHHYPFRLVPPEPLIAYLEQLCAEEQVRVEPGVLPLVVRAGTGSVRDTLSVLDQLIAGAEQGAVSYDLAVSLLGFTPEALLDDVIDAVAADDTPTVFRVVDRVVQSGQDPRRFVEDLLDRFRDLVIARALPEEAGAILHGMPEDQVRRLSAQAAQLSRAELSRLADVTNLALTDMVGATSPRLHLELLMARLVLPATDDTHRGLSARLEALERRLEYGGSPAASAPAQAAEAAETAEGTPHTGAVGEAAGLSGAALARAAMRRPEAEETTPSARQQDAPARQEQRPAVPTQAPAAPETPPSSAAPAAPTAPTPPSAPEQWSPPQQGGSPTPDEAAGRADAEGKGPEKPVPENTGAEPASAPPSSQRSGEAEGRAAAPSTSGTGPSSANPVEMVRRAWPDILAALEDSSRLVWMLVKDNASVTGYDGSLLTIGFQQDGPRQSLLGRGGDRVLAEAVHRVLGIRPELDLILGGDAPRPEHRASADARQASGRPASGSPRPQQQPPQDASDTRGLPRPPAPSGGQPRNDSLRATQSQTATETPGGAASGGQERASHRPAQPATAWPAPADTRTSPEPGRPTSAASAPPAAAPAPPSAPASASPAPSAPTADSWGHAGEAPPAWEDAPPSEEDPWDTLPEFDPDSDMEDSPGPEGWVPPQGAQEDGGPQENASSGTPGWDGPVPSPSDWGTPPQADQPAPAPRPDEAASPGAEPWAPAGPAPTADAAQRLQDVTPDAAERAYDPGPLVREPAPTIPVFARPEAELRAEFEARFGTTRPAGFDGGSRGGASDARGAEHTAPPAASDQTRTGRAGGDGVPPGQGDDPAASEREDPHPAASTAAVSSDAHPDATGEPSSDGTPAPGVPAHDGGGAPAAGTAPRGSGHPASMFPRLMERLEAGGPLEPPVNARDAGGDGTVGPSSNGPSASSGPSGSTAPPSGRPSPTALGARPTGDGRAAAGGEPPAPPAMDPRAAAIRAAREAAQGRAPARPAAPATASSPAVAWTDEVASDDDVALEDSGLVGRAVVERVLGGRLLEERPHEPVR